MDDITNDRTLTIKEGIEGAQAEPALAIDHLVPIDKNTPIEELVSVISSNQTSRAQRRAAMKAMASKILGELAASSLSKKGGSIPAADVALKYMRFLVELDVDPIEDFMTKDPLDVLSSITGISRDELSRLHTATSVTRFKKITITQTEGVDIKQDSSEE